MIHENIRAARKQCGASQEEIAQKCHVVRQTVAKWESGRSLPDAQMIVTLSEALQVPAAQLLGLPEGETESALRRELEALRQRQRMQEQASRARGGMLLLSIAALVIALRAGESLRGLAAVGVCLLGCLLVLWRSMGTLTHLTSPGAELRPIRIATAASAVLIAGTILLAALEKTGAVAMTAGAEKAFVTALTAGLMIFFGWLGPKLPYNRHTGLRLPWTVADADTWRLAHRVMGWLAWPTALLYIAAVCVFPDPGAATLAALAVYIGVPGVISWVYYWQKTTGRL